MNDHNSFFTATGIPSLFLIFSVLCLAVLSLLTLGNSRSELSTARNSIQQTEDYYNACSQASTVINEIQTELTDAYRQATDQKNYQMCIRDSLYCPLAAIQLRSDGIDPFPTYSAHSHNLYDEW